jgi:hypothetical protein
LVLALQRLREKTNEPEWKASLKKRKEKNALVKKDSRARAHDIISALLTLDVDDATPAGRARAYKSFLDSHRRQFLTLFGKPLPPTKEEDVTTKWGQAKCLYYSRRIPIESCEKDSLAELLTAVQSNVIAIACSSRRDRLAIGFFSYYALDEWEGRVDDQWKQASSTVMKNRLKKVVVVQL